MKALTGAIWSLALGVSVSACGGEDSTGAVPDETSHEEEDLHWSYAGAEGPEYWGTLSEDYALCGTGRFQSPVNFPDTLVPAELDHLGFDYAASAGQMINNGHTIVVEMDDDANELLVDGQAHTLLQFHFHADSEHRVDGKAYPLEIHFVHASDSGGLAVIGVFFEEGAENEPLAEVFSKMKDSSEVPLLLEEDLDLAALLPDESQGWTYSGSLTTPPCSEGVKWNVHAAPITASAAQLKAFVDLHDGSYRPVEDNEDIEEQLEELE